MSKSRDFVTTCDRLRNFEAKLGLKFYNQDVFFPFSHHPKNHFSFSRNEVDHFVSLFFPSSFPPKNSGVNIYEWADLRMTGGRTRFLSFGSAASKRNKDVGHGCIRKPLNAITITISRALVFFVIFLRYDFFILAWYS